MLSNGDLFYTESLDRLIQFAEVENFSVHFKPKFKPGSQVSNLKLRWSCWVRKGFKLEFKFKPKFEPES